VADVTTDKPYLLLIYAFLERESAAGADGLRQRGIVALPDFVCNAGAVIGYRSAAGATPGQILAVCVATGDERLYANLLLTVCFLTPSS
jgi:hypothetical protein